MSKFRLVTEPVRGFKIQEHRRLGVFWRAWVDCRRFGLADNSFYSAERAWAALSKELNFKSEVVETRELSR